MDNTSDIAQLHIGIIDSIARIARNTTHKTELYASRLEFVRREDEAPFLLSRTATSYRVDHLLDIHHASLRLTKDEESILHLTIGKCQPSTEAVERNVCRDVLSINKRISVIILDIEAAHLDARRQADGYVIY